MVTKYPVQEFDGVKYYRKPGGYYKAQYNAAVGTRYMHRDVWKSSHGPIPDRHNVHHKNHDRADNRLENLELVSATEHAKYHLRKRAEANPDYYKPGLAKAREAAKAWHASPEGHRWHVEHGRQTFGSPSQEHRKCTWCEKDFVGTEGRGKRGFCSMSCQGMARKASGVDNINVTCLVCGAVFRGDKYKPPKTCSKACWKAAIARARTRVQPVGSGG